MSGVAPPTVLQPGGCVTAAHMLAPPTSLWPFTSPREALQPKGWGCSHSHEGPEQSRFVPPTRGLSGCGFSAQLMKCGLQHKDAPTFLLLWGSGH